ncbi:prion-like-(Q/N-rich) domain-bearing protein 25 isoform X2 [Frankliniella occidentalis]|uniref:Prion-like-(Q/N-rich) domain-bearing protein 25 isoform X2 n=1 Tax=Frankliniella occidentalis TaxID=133901 RepID=A0A6J1SXF9_FRAOC|nr:prion-like-(Q/N-rich) domain-bearing protein 25 isoform X2 [Frankliniella occidentalis]
MRPRTAVVLDMARADAAAALTASPVWLWLVLVLVAVHQVVLAEPPPPESWRLAGRPQEQHDPHLGHPQRAYGGQRPPVAAFPPGSARGAPSWPGRAGPGPGLRAPDYPDYREELDGGGVGAPCDYDEDCPEYAYCRGQQTCECKLPYRASADGSSCLATIGTPCRSKYDCSGLGPGAGCDQDVCNCGSGYVPSADGSCVSGAQRLNDTCELNLQCETLGSGVACTSGRCACVPGRHAVNDRCIANIALHAACTQSNECFIGEGYQSVIECYSGTCRCKDQYTDLGDGKCSASGATRLSTVIPSLVIVLLSLYSI